MPPPFRHRTTKKEPRCSSRPTAALEERTEEIMDRVQKAGDNHVERVAALEEYLTLTRAHEGETWFDAGAWTEDLADSYLALGRVDDAVRTISDATRSGYAEGAEMLCELAEKLMRSGHEPQASALWQQARADYPDDAAVPPSPYAREPVAQTAAPRGRGPRPDQAPRPLRQRTTGQGGADAR